jgi:hypothetical protein
MLVLRLISSLTTSAVTSGVMSLTLWQWQGVTYFLADDGFYACNGQQVEPIGAEKVNRHFWDSARRAN